jgi:CheY-like chemotaxis protein
MDPMKILLVDDSKSARYALRLQLQRHGVEVDTADSAESAFERLKGELPDAILMDHMMPGLNGLEALDVIREDPRTAHLPVVMCTSHEDADFAATAERRGVIGILPKSGAPDKLPAILAKLRDSIQVPGLAVGASGGVESIPQATPGAAEPTIAATPSASTAIDEAQILARLDERNATRLTTLLDDLRRDLSERLTAEAQRQITTRLDTERQALERRLQEQRSAMEAHLEEQRRGLEEQLDSGRRSGESSPSPLGQEELKAQVEQLVKETLSSLVKVEVEAERGQIMGLVEEYLKDLGPRPQATGERDARHLASLEQAMTRKVTEIARFEAQTAVEGALSRHPQARQPGTQTRPALTGVYLAILAAALAGVGAAAAVFFVLS